MPVKKTKKRPETVHFVWEGRGFSDETIKKLQEIEEQLIIGSHKEGLNRARGITVGTAFGGTTEVTMRGETGGYLFSILQPVETLELIHQLAGSIGCHIHVKPREDFGSWRVWNEGKVPQRLPFSDQPPGIEESPEYMDTGRSLSAPEQNLTESVEVKEKENVVATKKTVNKRTPKRTRKSP